MVTARLFNERPGSPAGASLGCVTTGTVWRFLKPDGANLLIDQKEYYFATHPERVFGILLSALHAPAGQAA